MQLIKLSGNRYINSASITHVVPGADVPGSLRVFCGEWYVELRGYEARAMIEWLDGWVYDDFSNAAQDAIEKQNRAIQTAHDNLNKRVRP